MIGGTGLFFALISGLWCLYSLTQIRIYSIFYYGCWGLITLASLYALRAQPHLLWIVLLNPIVLFIFIAKYKHHQPSYFTMLGLLLLGLIAFSNAEQRNLMALKQQYAQFETGDTWQKLGAL
ncbi:hypothetical protein [Acinetobacter sp. MD2]|uniref:hypothetical protein n=1 Tax=Acinetobacter sp. MD2 TaxID=2600066 RepID=UPI002D1E72BF|nr:hypothetical protein [Acinetobacter sp. MD2]MEB3767334.1 hypothetical protein [Acinetobacter sp. MD2]